VVNEDNRVKFRERLTIGSGENARPHRPDALIDKPPEGYQWHHIIPYNTLRDTYNTLAAKVHDKHDPKAEPAFNQHMALCGISLEDRKEFIKGIHNSSLETHQIDVLKSAIAWPKWNVVGAKEGEGRDPGGSGLHRFPELSDIEKGRYKHIEPLYDALVEFNRKEDVSHLDVAKLFDAIKTCRPELQDCQPIRMGPDWPTPLQSGQQALRQPATPPPPPLRPSAQAPNTTAPPPRPAPAQAGGNAPTKGDGSSAAPSLASPPTRPNAGSPSQSSGAAVHPPPRPTRGSDSGSFPPQSPSDPPPSQQPPSTGAPPRRK
jgi:hypothetical protein